jgi:Flp pilus assembly protein TadG
MLSRFRQPSRKTLHCFLIEENGTSTIEFVILVPLFTVLLLLATDASLLFLRHTNLMNISRDTARIVSRHAMTVTEARTYAESNASTPRSRATAQVTIQDGFVIVILSSNAASSAPFGIISFVLGDRIVARAISTMEPV